MDSLPWHQTPPRGSAEAGKGPREQRGAAALGQGKALSPDLRISRTLWLGRELCVTRSALLRLLGEGPGCPRPLCVRTPCLQPA